MFSRTGFISILEKATSHLQLEPDWNAIIAVSDSIRQGDVEPKFALNSIKKKLSSPNLHVNMFALLVLESCVKNCGPSFHAEIATKSFMEELHEIVKGNTNEKVKEKVLELIQAWAHAFRNQPSYRPVQDMCNLLKLEGYKFPAFKESDAMFSASVAPEWVDGDCCNRCRVTFTLLERKHHCRNCGQVFCNKCSSRQSILPKFGIEKEVRVCEDCYEKLNTTSVLKPVTKPEKNSSTRAATTSSTTPAAKTEDELREEEELQMAIALSKSEAEIKEKQQRKYSNSYQSPFTNNFENEPTKETINKQQSQEKLDPNLNMYMNRAYWEQKSKDRESGKQRTTDSAQPSAPQQTLVKNKQQVSNQNEQLDNSNKTTTTVLLKSETDKDDIEQFQNNLKSTIEIFVNRMNSNKNRGRPISNDSAVQSMFLNITNMHSQLLKHIQQQDDLRSKFELLQDKLNQARDARAALDSLREEHNEKLRREAEEAEMIRQQQMAYKLDIMRKKKQEYLQYQRQIALQRVQDQEREMKMRLEQQKYGAWPMTSPIQSTVNQQLPNQPISQYNAMPVYPISQQQIPQSNYGQINYGDQTGMYNPPANQYSSTNQPNGNLQNHHPNNIHHSMQHQVLPQHMSQQQLPHQQLPVQQVTTIPTSDYSSQPFQQPQGVYNMQALNNSLPPTNTNLNNQTSPQPQQQPQYINQTSYPDNNQIIANDNNLSVNKPVEEAPLISFD